VTILNSYSIFSDEDLMKLIRKKEKRAFEELYVRYSKKILNYLYRFLAYDKEKAEDMLHDLFLKIIEKPEQFDIQKKFSNWIFSIATNMIKNEYKRQDIRNVYKEEKLIYSENFVESEWDTPDLITFYSQLLSELEILDFESRTLFELRYKEELPVKEIAVIMQLPEGTIKSRLFYMVKKLSQKLAVFNPNQ
jgi:RNA polymerase sigma factor (sigma-70 family)